MIRRARLNDLGLLELHKLQPTPIHKMLEMQEGQQQCHKKSLLKTVTYLESNNSYLNKKTRKKSV